MKLEHADHGGGWKRVRGLTDLGSEVEVVQEFGGINGMHAVQIWVTSCQR